MSDAASRSFDVRSESFTQVREWLAPICEKLKLTSHGAMQLTLVLEELFTNTQKHGYATTKGKKNLAQWPVWITLERSGRHVILRYEDAAFAYNPITNIQLPDYSGPVESWRIGGLGLPMIAGIATSMRYERSGDRNFLHLTLPV